MNTRLYKMQQDNVKDTIENDPLISEFGNRLFDKCGSKLHQYMVHSVREIARLLIQMRNTFPDTKFLEDGMKPTNWNKLIVAVKLEYRYDESSGKFRIPSLALKLAYSLVKCAKRLKKHHNKLRRCSTEERRAVSRHCTTQNGMKEYLQKLCLKPTSMSQNMCL